MRGYESRNTLVIRRIDWVTNPHEGLWGVSSSGARDYFSCYESPWGVMRIKKKKNDYKERKLRIPMRGYERDSVEQLNDSLSGYESPWGVMRIEELGELIKKTELRIPMRGYESSMMRLDCGELLVTNPHEGLWDEDWSIRNVLIPSYESPWGVMRLKLMVVVRQRLGYESPWGVMRLPARTFWL